MSLQPHETNFMVKIEHTLLPVSLNLLSTSAYFVYNSHIEFNENHLK